MKTIQQVLEAKGREVYSIAPEALVFDALGEMANLNIGSLVVLDGDDSRTSNPVLTASS